MTFSALPALLSRPRLGVAAALGLAWFALAGWQLLVDGAPLFRDGALIYLPIRAFLHDRLRAGELPEWFPFETLGVPFIGQIVTGTFHPQVWLLLPFNALTALKLNILLAYLAGLAGAYRMARASGAARVGSTAAALAFGMGGYAVSMADNLPYLCGLVTLPWVGALALRLAERRRTRSAVGLGVCWALVFLAGDAQSFLFVPLLLAPAFAYHAQPRRLWLWPLAAGLAAALIGVELLPALAVSAESLRAAGEATPGFGLAWALHPLRIAGLAVPGLVPDEARVRIGLELLGGNSGLWAATLFAGVCPLLLALAGLSRRTAGYGAVALLSLGLSLGDHGGLLPLVWKIVPVLERLRYPEKYLAFFWVALVPLVAAGVDAVARRPGRLFKPSLGAAALFGALAAAVHVFDGPGWVWSQAGRSLAEGDPLRQVVRQAWALGFVSSCAVSLILCLVAWGARIRPGLLALIPLIAFGELWLGNGPYLPAVPASVVREPTVFEKSILSLAPPDQPPQRALNESRQRAVQLRTRAGNGVWVAASRLQMTAELPALSGIAAVGPTLPGTSYRTALALGARSESAAARADRFGICYRVLDLDAPVPPGARVMETDPWLGLVLVRTACEPRAYLAASVPVGGATEAQRALEQGLKPRQAVWEGGPRLGAAEGEARWAGYRPERLRLTVTAAAPTALIVNEAFSRGWTAWLDGRQAPLFPANLQALGMPLPAGEHAVELRYRTPRLLTGALLSLAGILLCVGLLGVEAARSRGARLRARR